MVDMVTIPTQNKEILGLPGQHHDQEGVRKCFLLKLTKGIQGLWLVSG